MKAVVLAGGMGTRLRPLTERIPKPLMPIAGTPCIDFVLTATAKAGFTKMILTTGYLSDAMLGRVGDGSRYGASVLYSIEPQPLGTAGAVKKVGDFLDTTFVVVSGDLLADVDIKAIYEYHKKKGALATMALTEVANPTEFGIVGLDDDGRIVKFKEKPKPEEAFSNLVNAGIYVLEPEALERIPSGKSFDFSRNLFPILMEEGAGLYGKPAEGLWMDIGRPSDLLRASLAMIERRGSEATLDGAECSGKLMLGKDVRAEKGARIAGPAYIGDGVKIGAGSVVERSCVYAGCEIGAKVNARESIFLDGCKVGDGCQVVDSIVAWRSELHEDARLKGTLLGEGTKVKKGSILENAHITGNV